MLIYFNSRSKARQSIPAAKLVDNGASAPNGKRYARDISGLSKLTRKALVQQAGSLTCKN